MMMNKPFNNVTLEKSSPMIISIPSQRLLNNLSGVDQLLIRQRAILLETSSNYGIGRQSKNKIKNANDDEVYMAVEETHWIYKRMYTANREFNMIILDPHGNRVIHMHRRLASDCGFCPCWLQRMTVSYPHGQVIGTVEQKWSLWEPRFSVKNAADDAVLKIKGPARTTRFVGRDMNFNVIANDGKIVGKIAKQCLNMMQAVTNESFFSVSFPKNIDVETKALLLGALFLIDYMFFESLVPAHKSRF